MTCCEISSRDFSIDFDSRIGRDQFLWEFDAFVNRDPDKTSVNQTQNKNISHDNACHLLVLPLARNRADFRGPGQDKPRALTKAKQFKREKKKEKGLTLVQQ